MKTQVEEQYYKRNMSKECKTARNVVVASAIVLMVLILIMKNLV